MHTKFLKSIFILIATITCATGTAFAVDYDAKVTRVYSNNSLVLIRLDKSVKGESCSGAGENWIRIYSGDSQFESELKIALAAYLSGRPVSVRTSGCSWYPRLSFIFLK